MASTYDKAVKFAATVLRRTGGSEMSADRALHSHRTFGPWLRATPDIPDRAERMRIIERGSTDILSDARRRLALPL